MIAYLRSGLKRTLCLSLLTFVSAHSMHKTLMISLQMPLCYDWCRHHETRKDWLGNWYRTWMGQKKRWTRTYFHYQHIFVSSWTDSTSGGKTTDTRMYNPYTWREFWGIANAAIGTKIKVYEGGKVFPKVSFMGTILIPGGSNAHYLPNM